MGVFFLFFSPLFVHSEWGVWTPAGIGLPTRSRTDLMFYNGLCHLYWSVLCNISLHGSKLIFCGYYVRPAKNTNYIFKPAIDNAIFMFGHRCTLCRQYVTSPNVCRTFNTVRENDRHPPPPFSHYTTWWFLSLWASLVQPLRIQSYQSNHF